MSLSIIVNAFVLWHFAWIDLCVHSHGASWNNYLIKWKNWKRPMIISCSDWWAYVCQHFMSSVQHFSCIGVCTPVLLTFDCISNAYILAE